MEDWGDGHSGPVFTVGPNVRTHRRHHIQQSEYTFATKRIDREWAYANHDSAFSDKELSLLTKYLVPRSDRPKVLAKLDRMNINSYSLFGNEEGLMETLAGRYIG